MHIQDNKHLFKSIVTIAEQTSVIHTKEYPKLIKPVAKTIIFLSVLMFAFLYLPFSMLRKKHMNTFFMLRTSLENKWYSESSHAALFKLRMIYQTLKVSENKILFGGTHIKPYGRFGIRYYIMTADLLYHWELIHGNWKAAHCICEDAMNFQSKITDRHSIDQSWIIKKGQTLLMTNGKTAAQEFLLQNLDPENKNCPVKSYLYKIRNAS